MRRHSVAVVALTYILMHAAVAYAGVDSADIGGASPAGDTKTGGDYEVSGSGGNVWDRSDQFRYVYQPQSGDFTAIVRIAGVTAQPGVEALVGIMARSNIDANAANVYARTTSNAGTTFKLGVRSTTGGTTASLGNVGANAYPDVWIRLKRTGNEFAASFSTDSQNWRDIGKATVAMPADCLVGLAVCSRTPGKLATAQFKSFAVIANATTQPATKPAGWPANVPTPPTIPAASPSTTVDVPLGADLKAQNFSRSGTAFSIGPGAHVVSTDGMAVKGSDILIAGKPVKAGTQPQTIINNAIPAGTEKYAKVFRVDSTSERITFRDILFKSNGTITLNTDGTVKSVTSGIAIGLAGKNVRLENCWAETCQLAFARGVDGVELTTPHTNVVNEYGMFLAEDGPLNQNIVLRDPDFAGSLTAHSLRTYAVKGLWIVGGSMRNPDNIQRPNGAVHGHPLNFIDGQDYYVVNTEIVGSSRAGPLSNVGKASNAVRHVVVANCRQTDVMWYLEAGMTDFTMQDSTGGIRLTLRSPLNYQGTQRNRVSGALANIVSAGPGKFASVEAPPNTLRDCMNVQNVTYNGVQQ